MPLARDRAKLANCGQNLTDTRPRPRIRTRTSTGKPTSSEAADQGRGPRATARLGTRSGGPCQGRAVSQAQGDHAGRPYHHKMKWPRGHAHLLGKQHDPMQGTNRHRTLSLSGGEMHRARNGSRDIRNIRRRCYATVLSRSI